MVHPIHALWAHPRSMSTAFERVMRERGDLDCLHEPFMYDYYIHRQARRMPMFQPEPGHPVSYDDVRAMIRARARTGPVFFKDMAYYVTPHLTQDAAFCEQMSHAFLVRDPAGSIASYHKLDPDVTSDEIGIKAQWQHYQLLLKRGATPFVMLAEDVRADPVGVISAYWAHVGLVDSPHAFDWQEEPPKDWQQVSGWHGDVMASSGILPQAGDSDQVRFAKAVAQAPHLQSFLDEHRPYYQRFKAVAHRRI